MFRIRLVFYLMLVIDFDFPSGLHLSSRSSPLVLPRLSVSQVGVTVPKFQMITNQNCRLYSHHVLSKIGRGVSRSFLDGPYDILSYLNV